MMNKNKNRRDNYYVRQAAMCKLLGIKPAPKYMGLIRRTVYFYKQLRQENLK